MWSSLLTINNLTYNNLLSTYLCIQQFNLLLTCFAESHFVYTATNYRGYSVGLECRLIIVLGLNLLLESMLISYKNPMNIFQAHPDHKLLSEINNTIPTKVISVLGSEKTSTNDSEGILTLTFSSAISDKVQSEFTSTVTSGETLTTASDEIPIQRFCRKSPINQPLEFHFLAFTSVRRG